MKNSQAKSAKFVMSYVIIATLVIIAGLTYLTMPILRQYQALKSSDPIAAADVNLSDLTTGQHYYLEDATVVDGYCYTSTSDSEEDAQDYSLLILFPTGSDQLAAASMTITPDDAIWDPCVDYLNDMSMEVGDLEFPIYGYTTDVMEDSDQGDFYTQALSDFRANGLAFNKTELEFHYLGSTQEEYQEYVDSQLHDLTVRLAVIGAAVLLLIVGCICVVVIMTKKIKEQKEDSDIIPGSPEIR